MRGINFEKTAWSKLHLLTLKPPKKIVLQKSDQNRFYKQITLMIDGAGTNHFATLMMFMNYSCILKIGNSHTKVHISPREGREGTAIYAIWGTCMSHCEGYGFQALYSWIGYINHRVVV